MTIATRILSHLEAHAGRATVDALQAAIGRGYSRCAIPAALCRLVRAGQVKRVAYATYELVDGDGRRVVQATLQRLREQYPAAFDAVVVELVAAR